MSFAYGCSSLEHGQLVLGTSEGQVVRISTKEAFDLGQECRVKVCFRTRLMSELLISKCWELDL